MNKKPILSQAEQNIKPAIRAYLGGSFDPVHHGHTQMAMAVYNTLAPIATEQNRELQVSLLPNARSPFKAQSTDHKDRLTMLKLAVQETPLQICELELWQAPPVYTIDSVRMLRERYPNDSLIFIMGMDSARTLEQWKDGLQLTDYVHLWIFNRTQNDKQIKQNTKTLANEVPVALQSQITSSLIPLLSVNNYSGMTPLANEPLKDTLKGRIYMDTRAVISVSSTEIRRQFFEQYNVLSESTKPVLTQLSDLTQWLDPKVYDYIMTHQLYSAD